MAKKIENSELQRLTVDEFKQTEKRPIVLVLDNVRSQHNIGAAFRTADAFCIEKIYLCGICATPPSAEIHKSALGAEDTVSWQHFRHTTDAITQLKEKGYTVLGIEQVEGGVMLNKFTSEKGKKYALVFGNEVKGITQEAVDLCDGYIEIPQEGTKHSLNVSVSIGVVLWDFYCRL